MADNHKLSDMFVWVEWQQAWTPDSYFLPEVIVPVADSDNKNESFEATVTL